MPQPTSLPDWEEVLSAAARLQQMLPDAVLVGGTASAIHAQHRFSGDADHVLRDLRERFDGILEQLESVAGWKTAREETRLTEYKNLALKWQDWQTVKDACSHLAAALFDRIAALEPKGDPKPQRVPKSGGSS